MILFTTEYVGTTIMYYYSYHVQYKMIKIVCTNLNIEIVWYCLLMNIIYN